jgi:hypothetical protein
MVPLLQIVYYCLGILVYSATFYTLMQKEKNASNGHS